MTTSGYFSRVFFLSLGLAFGLMFSTGASAQALKFHFHFDGNMTCMSPVPVSDAPISGDGNGTLNPDGSVQAVITQGLLIFKTSLNFDSKLGPGLTPVPGGTGQMRVTGRSGLRFVWNLPNNSIIVNVNVRGQSCTATFQSPLLPGKTNYTFFDGSIYHTCGKPTMTSSSCEIQ
jgi:hypothetical protein